MKYLISIILICSSPFTYSQQIGEYYKQCLIQKNQGFLKLNDSLSYMNIGIMAGQNSNKVIIEFLLPGNIIEEAVVIGPIDSFWFLIQGQSWDEEIDMKLDSLNKIAKIYCFNQKFEPLYLIMGAYGYTNNFLFIKKESGLGFIGFNSKMITDLTGNIQEISINQLLKMARSHQYQVWNNQYIKNLVNLNEKLKIYSNSMFILSSAL